MLTVAALVSCQNAPDVAGLQSLATEGDASAQFDLAFMYRNGEGVPQDNRQALRCYRLALILSRCGQHGFSPDTELRTPRPTSKVSACSGSTPPPVHPRACGEQRGRPCWRPWRTGVEIIDKSSGCLFPAIALDEPIMTTQCAPRRR